MSEPVTAVVEGHLVVFNSKHREFISEEIWKELRSMLSEMKKYKKLIPGVVKHEGWYTIELSGYQFMISVEEVGECEG